MTRVCNTTAYRKDINAIAKFGPIKVLLPVVIGTFAMLKWVTPDDYTLMGPNFAMALMSFLYAVVLHTLVILPYSVIIKRRTIELNIEI